MNSKIKNHHKSIPEMYQQLRTDPAKRHCCMVEDVNHQFFLYNRPEENNVVARAVHKIWPGFESFSEENRQTILAYHDELFKRNPPKGQSDVDTALWVWFGLCSKSTDRTTTEAKTPGGRSSTILSSRYSRGRAWADNLGAESIKTPQALQCYRMLRDELSKREQEDLGGMPPEVAAKYEGPSISEEEFRQVVTARAGELHTKQDPWRIFQYYRPQLMQAGIIRRS